MYRMQRGRPTGSRSAPGDPASELGGRGGVLAAMSAVMVVAVLGWPAPAVAQIAPQTHFDSLYPTTTAPGQCVDGVGGTPAQPTNHFCLTDSAVTSWYSDAADGSTGDILNPGFFEFILEREYEPTALTMSRTFNPKFSGTGETDIFYQRGVISSGHLGVAWCNDAVEGTDECDQHYVRFTVHTPSGHLICHETGHAVGLTHGPDASPVQPLDDFEMGCMGSAGSELTAALTTQLNAHYQNQ